MKRKKVFRDTTSRNGLNRDSVPDEPYDPAKLRTALEAAVHRQLMSDVPYGVLISGGIDSSIVAAVAAKFSARRVDENDLAPAWWPRLHSFAIGLEGAPDLLPAKTVADHIGSVHHEIHFTVQEGLDALVGRDLSAGIF